MTKILITGSNGQLGLALQRQKTQYTIIACPRSELDITEANSIKDAIQKYQPDCIINCAAYTQVDQAEQEATLADNINHQGANLLALACQSAHIPIIHLSTDYVFANNESKKRLDTHTPTNPQNIYGKTKLAGEQAIRNILKQHIILRVCGIFSADKTNFVKAIVKLAQEREQLDIVSDQITCPTAADHIATVIFSMLDKLTSQTRHNLWGTYHYCDQPEMSWYEFAKYIVAIAEKHTKLAVKTIQPITTAQLNRPAKRSLYSVFDCEKLKRDFNIKQSNWQQALPDIITNILHA